jgi:hypothetical protein
MQALATREDWGAYVRDPTWLPHYYDAFNDTLIFARLPREAQRALPFIDPRFVKHESESPPIPIAKLSVDVARQEAGALHFIFHTGFCCSTLLTRALDVPGVSMGLKEPGVLASFADYWSNSRRAVGAPEALSLTLDLLSRPLSYGETQIVKPSTTANHIIPQLLHARQDAKAVLLFSSLDTFLRAIARRGLEGRMFARQLFRQFAPVNPLAAGFTGDDALLHSDLQIAAQAWLMQASFMEQIANRFGASRVRVLSSESLLAEPAATLTQIGAFFDLGIPAETAQKIAEGPIFQEHAKELGRPFNAAAQKRQHDEAGQQHREELMMAKTWARALAIRCGAPLVLDESLRG